MGAYQSQEESQSQPQLQPQYSRPQLQSQYSQPSQLQPQSQQHQQQQPQPHEPRRRESWLLSPEGNTKPSKNSTKTVDNNNATTVKSTDMTGVKPLKQRLPVPHSYQDILEDADSPLYKPSGWPEDLLDQLYAGVFLDHKTKKYWVEKKSHGNCFMLYARALSITWAENPNYWKWVQHKEESGTMTELARLKMVCWLEVHGKFDIKKLTPGMLYQVSFIIMLKDLAEGWEIPINVRLVLPGGKKQEHKEILMEKSRERWIEIPVGEFVASENDVGEMEISMYEYEGGMWKTGLVIQGVAIKPKN